MSTYFSGLNMVAYSLGSTNYLGVLQNCTIRGDNTGADSRGVAQRYQYEQAVKQGQIIDFTHYLPGVVDTAASNLDISAWSIGGTNYLSNLRTCDINITNTVKERSGVSSAYKFPNLVSTAVEITAEHLIINAAALTPLILGGTVSTFAVVAALTYAGEAFSAPMNLKSARHEIKRDEMQMENVTMSLRGTPTGPSDSTLLGAALIGTAAIAVAIDTGAEQYNTAVSQVAVITKLSLKVKDAALLEITGTLEVQGALTLVAG